MCLFWHRNFSVQSKWSTMERAKEVSTKVGGSTKHEDKQTDPWRLKEDKLEPFFWAWPTARSKFVQSTNANSFLYNVFSIPSPLPLFPSFLFPFPASKLNLLSSEGITENKERPWALFKTTAMTLCLRPSPRQPSTLSPAIPGQQTLEDWLQLMSRQFSVWATLSRPNRPTERHIHRT